jgi:3'(2'), 5'-bisphosphate nucleotidase
MTHSTPIHARLDDVDLAEAIAKVTSDALVQLAAESVVDPQDPAAVAALKDAGDALAHGIITEALERTRPGDAVMSEEGDWADPARLTASRVWIVDPLDATKEFGIGIPDWAVQIALLERDQLTAAAMHLGGRGVSWSTRSAVAFAPQVHTDGTLIAVVSRSRAPQGLEENLARVAASLSHVGVERVALRSVGGVGGKVDELLQGRAHLYIGPTWCQEWDAAAPVAIAARHGHMVCGDGGRPLTFNQADARVQGLLVGPELLVRAWLDVTGDHPAHD